MIKSITATAAQALAESGLVQLVDATWQLPGDQPVRGFLRGTTASVDTAALKALPHGERAATAHTIFGASGVMAEGPVCVYDRAGSFSAPWVAWLLASHGYSVSLVTGAAPEGSAPMSEAAEPQSINDPDQMNAKRDDVLEALGTDIQVVDARSPQRFAGTAPEPRLGCRSGHIPGSLNLHYRSLLSDGNYIEIEDVAEVVARLGLDLSRPIITTCGSGVTASLLAVALQRVGAENVKVYQGSWAEWGMDPSLPLETGT